ncbi:hypothetical protein INT43_002114 [Umbelopsis isabellina]|uniref:GRIP domain-containing protein n=1 Tax=Mortierella isabellina TaxID=91625 RepID=A0A8H7PRQ8_MORIS|nr:hypothetical protein INT43_002114 [Umbelopsis isabellina]
MSSEGEAAGIERDPDLLEEYPENEDIKEKGVKTKQDCRSTGTALLISTKNEQRILEKDNVTPKLSNVELSDAADDTTSALLELKRQLEAEQASRAQSKLEWATLKKDLEAQLENLRTDSNDKETALKQLKVENSQLVEQIDKFTETTENYSKSSSEMKKDHLSKVQELEASIQSLKEKVDEKHGQVTGDVDSQSICNEMSSLRSQNEELSLQLTKQKDEVEKAHNDMKLMRQLQADSDERGKKYVAVLNKTKKQILKLEKEKSDATDEVAKLQSELMEIRELLSTAVQKEQDITAASSELQKTIQERDTAIADQCSKLRRQESELAILSKERKVANDSKMQAEDELQLKTAQYESSQIRVAHLEMRLKESEQQSEELYQRLSGLEEQLANSEQHVNRLKGNEEAFTKKSSGDLSTLQQLLDDVTKELTIERENAKQMKAANEKEQSEKLKRIEELQLELQSAQAQLEETNSILLERTTASNDSQSQVESLRSSLVAAENKIEYLSTSSTQISNELNQLKDWAGTIRSEKEEIERQLEESRMKETHFKSMNKVGIWIPQNLGCAGPFNLTPLHTNQKTLKDEIKRFTKVTPVSQASMSAASSRSASPSTKASSPSIMPNPPNIQNGQNGQADSHDSSLSQSISEVNLEYLKHIIMGFMENRQTRNQLIPVLSMLLKLNNEEIKRLQAAS